MAVLVAPVAVAFRTGARIITSPWVTVFPRTSAITLSLRRPTTAVPLAWDASSTILVTVEYRLDGVVQAATSRVTGGVRTRRVGGQAGSYQWTWAPGLAMPGEGAARVRADGQAWRSVGLDGPDQYVRLLRRGEHASECQARIVLEQIAGNNIDTQILLAQTTEADAPLELLHHSVAFDSSTSAQEAAGDGEYTVTLDPTGTSNLGAFVGAGGSSGAGGHTMSVTYDGNAMTELWDFAFDTSFQNMGAVYAAVSSASKVYALTTTGSPDESAMGVIAVTGLHQTTASCYRTPVTYLKTSGVCSRVTDLACEANDLMVDTVYGSVAQTVATGQTLREDETVAGAVYFRMSSKPGSSRSGMMGYTHASGTVGLGGVSLKPPDTTMAVTDTATAAITEADVVAGGKKIVCTLTEDTWVEA